jgi:hypothetical protein
MLRETLARERAVPHSKKTTKQSLQKCPHNHKRNAMRRIALKRSTAVPHHTRRMQIWEEGSRISEIKRCMLQASALRNLLIIFKMLFLGLRMTSTSEKKFWVTGCIQIQ